MARFNLPFWSIVALLLWVGGIYTLTKYRACKASSECQTKSSEAVVGSILFVNSFPLQAILVEEWYGRVLNRPRFTRLKVMCWHAFFLTVNIIWLLFLFFEYESVTGMLMAAVFTLFNMTLGLCTWIYWDNMISGAGHPDLLEAGEHVGPVDEEAASSPDGKVLCDVATASTAGGGGGGGKGDPQAGSDLGEESDDVDVPNDKGLARGEREALGNGLGIGAGLGGSQSRERNEQEKDAHVEAET